MHLKIVFKGMSAIKIQEINLEDGILTIFADYKRSEQAGAGGCFQIVDIYLNNQSILNKLNIDQGRHYFTLDEVAKDLKVNSNEIDIIETHN